jgi:hypothetical protein
MAVFGQHRALRSTQQFDRPYQPAGQRTVHEPNASTAALKRKPAVSSARLNAERMPQPFWLSTHA